MSQDATAVFRLPGETIPRLIKGDLTDIDPGGDRVVFAPFPGVSDRTLYLKGMPREAESPLNGDWFGPRETRPEGVATSSGEAHEALVQRAIDAIKGGEAEKIVVARRFVSSQIAHPLEVFDWLCAAYPEAMVWCLSSSETGTWVGATPELLLKAKGEYMQTVSLAGTRISGIAWTDKERTEQKIVTDYIVTELTSGGAREMTVGENEEMEYGLLRHLLTRVSFKADSAKGMVALLHPTPAVCGRPKKAALDFITNHEGGNRGLYTGYFGFLEENGDALLYVNLRCMKLFINGLMVFAGGGITEQSDPASEVKETERKAESIMPGITVNSELN
jgi:isochorismate synthase